MSDGKPLDGLAAFVTGGSGGIGSASARLLIRDGAAVLLMARRPEALDTVKARLLSEFPDAVIGTHAGDGTKKDDVVAGIEKAFALRQRLDILVPTVGGGIGYRPILMYDEDALRTEFEANLLSVFLVVRYGVPRMADGGSIVCISSTAAKMAFRWLAGYCMSKGGLEHFVRALAEELAPAKIRINAVRPGLTETDGIEFLFTNKTVHDAFMAEIPLGRHGKPDDIAQAVRYLAGPESAWVTGQSIAVDGGTELRKNPDLGFLLEDMYGKAAVDAALRGKTL